MPVGIAARPTKGRERFAEPAVAGLGGFVSVRVVVAAEVLVPQLAKLGAKLLLLLTAQFVELFTDVGGAHVLVFVVHRALLADRSSGAACHAAWLDPVTDCHGSKGGDDLSLALVFGIAGVTIVSPSCSFGAVSRQSGRAPFVGAITTAWSSAGTPCPTSLAKRLLVRLLLALHTRCPRRCRAIRVFSLHCAHLVRGR